MTYGHIVGAAIFSLPRHRLSLVARTDRLLVAAFSLVSLLVLFGLYASALHVTELRAPLLVAMLALSLWHIVENDFELGRAYRTRMQLGAIRFDRSSAPRIVAGLVIVTAIVLCTPSGIQLSEFLIGRPPLLSRALVLDDFVVFVVLYHAVSWIVFLLDRARASEELTSSDYAQLKRRLAWLHLAPVVPFISLSFWFEPIYLYIAAPGLYVFFSIAHTLHTATLRGVARAPAG